MKKRLTLYLIIFIALYLSLSFAFMSLNPTSWTIFGRSTFLVAFFGLTVLADLVLKK